QVRAMLLQSGKWKMEWGHPLNQADSMATILEFSTIFLTGLRALGFIFSKREREAIVHLWRYVGYLMGVEEHILPACEDDAMRAMYLMAATIPPPDEDTRALGQSLADAPLKFAGDGWLAQRLARTERTLRIGYTRYVLGDKAGDALGLPRTAAKYFWPAQIPVRLGAELVRASVPPVNRLMVKWGEQMAEKQFPQQVKQHKADTSFTPVKELAR
ncbi:MAG TPA: oxygenase MpaB family protein, partial [Dongiaceae bacterium]|nr:oxygenase MpaB family protein [Dongiaceae bacterium]